MSTQVKRERSRQCFIGSQVWVKVKNEERIFELGEVIHISNDRRYTVKSVQGETFVRSLEDLKVTFEKGSKQVEDLLNLSDYSEESLVYSLRERYYRDDFYSYAGPILVSINPYKWCDIYSESHMARYKGQKLSNVPPHIFAIAENAYHQLIHGGTSQAVIISGESGAGKTEATKIIMSYLSKAGNIATGGQGLETKVLNSNPLLEAFGNAKTVRNDNSSRFGKFIEIEMDPTGRIEGAKIINYLLEKSRIIGQMEGERNYHIFYQLLRGADENLLQNIGLDQVSEQRLSYVRTGSEVALNDVDDYDNFIKTRKCLETIGVTPEEEQNIFSTLAAVLLLGNIEFREVEAIDGCECDDFFLQRVTGVLGLNKKQLLVALCTHVVEVGGETIHKPVLPHVARDKRDALAKALYALLFRWLVLKVNSSLGSGVTNGHGTRRPRVSSADSSDSNGRLRRSDSSSHTSRPTIGILDIYGFEVFETNSFEQFCINFANEKLQRHFNRHIFEVEQEEYSKEGIDWSRIEFNDNQACIDLIDAGQSSLLVLLDEECLMPKGSDESLLRKLHTHHKDKHQHYIHPRFGNHVRFGVQHYAGAVEYTVDGFLQKNNDFLSESFYTMMKVSRLAWFQKLFGFGSQSSSSSGGSSGTGSGRLKKRRSSSLRPPTVSDQFRKQLGSLITKLEACQPHFVRCIKPNEEKSAEFFHSTKCLQQLRHAGMLETIRIRDQGYALRETHELFHRRFRVLAPNAKDCKELVSQIAHLFGLEDASQWQIGRTKVFLRRDMAELLDRTAACRLVAASRIISRALRLKRKKKEIAAVSVLSGFYDRIRFKVLRRRAIQVQCAIRISQAKKRVTYEESRKALSRIAAATDKAKLEQGFAQTHSIRNLPSSQRQSIPAKTRSTKRPDDRVLAPPSKPPPPVPEYAYTKAQYDEQVNRALVAEKRVAQMENILKIMEEKSHRMEQMSTEASRTNAHLQKRLKASERKSNFDEENKEKLEISERKCFLLKEKLCELEEKLASNSMLENEIVKLKLNLKDWDQREKIIMSRSSDLTEFVETVFGCETEESKQPSRASSTMEDTIDILFTTVKQQMRKTRDQPSSVVAAPVPAKKPENIEERESPSNAEYSALNTSITQLMRENIALMDEIVETRARHNVIVRKMAQAKSRAEHAEQANETLCTLLAWRDEQIEQLVSSNKSEFSISKNAMATATPGEDTERLEKAIQSLSPYFHKIANKFECKFSSGQKIGHVSYDHE
mmetsp:Transcript_1384/g.1840  ORF Transcript_1384/g.1840 Transcript_1384/m.1840 type:complete len:1250 (-) Transcript_1384:96-3845(-)